MYTAKREGKNRYRLFGPAMHEGVMARLELRNDLQRALATDQFALHYQPVMKLADGTVSGVEACVALAPPREGTHLPRRLHPDCRGDRPDHPDRTMGAARGLSSRPSPGRRRRHRLRINVNLSLRQIQHSDIVADVRDALDEVRPRTGAT